MARIEPIDKPPPSPWGSVVAVAVALGGLAVGYWTCSHAPPSSLLTPPSEGSADGPTPSASSGAEAGKPESHCADVSPDAFVIGEAPSPKPSPQPQQPSEWPIPELVEPDDLLAPFAVELGRGAVFDGGFAAGCLRDAEGGTVAMVATLGFDGKNGKLVKLARSRGDLEPPVVAGAGADLLAVMLEPNAGGRSIKIAKVTGDQVTFGAELAEGRDESLAIDVASSGDRAVVVWDDVPKEAKRSSVILASFDTATLRSITRPRPATPPNTDADSPRVVARPGGYWLAYIARSDDPAGDPEAAPKPKKKGKPKDDEDTAAAGEAIAKRWIELMPLDESGAATATARAVTPKDGHVLAFDLELGEGGAALLAFRDDDTPSGSSGGRVSSVLVREGGGEEIHVLSEEGNSAGVPELLPGWVSIAGISGPPRLATLTSTGELSSELTAEPSIGGGGEPLAAAKGVLLVARPAGRAMKLSVMSCTAVPKAASDAGSGGAPPVPE